MDEPTAALSVAAITRGARFGEGTKSARRLDHHHQPPPGRCIPGKRPDNGAPSRTRRSATVPSQATFTSREQVVAYMIGARDDFAKKTAE